jgi:hypothetical protein
VSRNGGYERSVEVRGELFAEWACGVVAVVAARNGRSRAK